ncbi:two-component system phosphate regulon sensor histidine kinase PhoR [Rhodovulum imhoffii]|uniref:histidine kinase n=1 Tax=Rhodovulum imhoffii TaxID=365340 RepID=A0A2T5BTP4_9RHOB|nr:ATP-binding protein [Rhodovulum imhoffii]MBK5934126.1 two-component sensor histidine kinase [Rhodovulum imhoffii]PTN02801.1 two-component system phosphate regulon sensor histidine kinase PhoR [Rhodovulum imhoffii]
MSSDLIESLISGLPLPVFLVSGDERIVHMSPAAQEMFGRALTGRHYIGVLRQPAILDCIEETLRLNQMRRSRYLTTEHGADATYEVISSPVRAPDGEGALVTLLDVSEREKAGQIRRDFVANVSHELKTPLTALLGFIETLKGAAREDAAVRARFLDIMEREAGRMNRLVSDLLSLSRVESEERMRPSERVDIVALVHAAALTLRSVAQDAGVALEIDTPDAPMEVQGDSDQLVQVLTNLVENGIKYGGAGGRVRIIVTHSPRELAFRGPAVRIDVVDYGEGFDPVHIPRLTERFYRVDSHRSREMGGTGLGLAIVKHIVNRHRGRFRIASEKGQGSRFSVMLPLA